MSNIEVAKKEIAGLMRDALKAGLDDIHQMLDNSELQEACEKYADYFMSNNQLIKLSWEVSLKSILCKFRREEQEKVMAKIKDYFWHYLPYLFAALKGLI